MLTLNVFQVFYFSECPHSQFVAGRIATVTPLLVLSSAHIVLDVSVCNHDDKAVLVNIKGNALGRKGPVIIRPRKR